MKTPSNARHRPTAACLFAVLFAALLATTLLVGCGPQRRDEPVTEPLNYSDERVLLGHRVFSQHCHQCHPGGAAGLAPAINDKPLPVTLIRAQIRQGHGNMPKFSEQEISDEEVDGIVRYLKGLRALQG
jgi:mono/diheme cytochrome c family protein